MSDELEHEAEASEQTTEGPTDDEQLEILYPGTIITLKGEGGMDMEMKITVWPMGIRDFKRFKAAIRAITEEVSLIGFDWVKAKEDWQTVLLPIVITIVVDHFLELLNESVDGIDLMSPRCPQWVLPPVAQAWLLQSFGSEKKLRPWADLVDEIAERAGGKKLKIWQMLTKSSSPQATGSTKSAATLPAPSASGSKPQSKPKARPKRHR